MRVQASLSARRALILLAVAAVTVAGGWLRLSRLDLMEFKQDEYTVHALALRNASGNIQLSGDRSSTGIPNPPLGVYIMSLPALFSPSPLALVLLPALLATLAVPLCYVLARQWMSRLAALSATVLFAFAPWVVLNSRKIWVPDILPFFAILFFLFLVDWMRRGRALTFVAAAAALAVINQASYSTMAMLVLFLYAVLRNRRALRPRAVVGAAAVALVLWTPFFLFLAGGGWRQMRSFRAEPLTVRLFASRVAGASALHACMPGKGAFMTTFGSGRNEWPHSPLRDPRAEPSVLGWLLVVGLLAASWRARRRRSLRLLLLWLVLPTLAVGFHRFFIHYLFVTWPSQFILLGVLFDAVCRGVRRLMPALLPWARALLLFAAAAFALSNAAFFTAYMDCIDRNGGTSRGYGAPWRDRMRIARCLYRLSPSEDFVLVDPTAPDTADIHRYLYRFVGGTGAILDRRSGISRVARVITVAKPGQAPWPARPRGFSPASSSALGPFVVTHYVRPPSHTPPPASPDLPSS